MEITNNLNRSYWSLCFWSWNYDMDHEEIKRQIIGFKEQNVGGFFIHSRAGLRIPYMGNKWLDAVGYAIDQAKKYDLEVWLYDEDGWPSGFCGGVVPDYGVEYQQKRLIWKYGLPNEDQMERLVGAFVCKDGKYTKCSLDDIKCFAGRKVLYFYFEANPHYGDLLNINSVQYFIENTHEIYYKRFPQEFGHTIKGIFTDEPQLAADGLPYTFGFDEYFTKMFGYSIMNYLPHLVEKVDGYQKYRHDYWKAVTSLFVESYTKTLYNWCEKHNIALTGHMPGEDGLCSQVAITGSVMPHYEYMQMPGIDHLGNRLTSPVLAKQVSSVARQLNKKYVLSETFGCSGWNISFRELAWIWGWQALLGINVPCFHLSAFSIKGCRKRDYPPVFSYQQPWWDDFHKINDYFTRLNKYLSLGDRDTDILILHPITGIWCEFSLGLNNTVKVLSSEFRQLSENLLNMQYDFDYGDETILKKYGRVEDTKIFINDKSYKIIIVPYTVSIEDSTYEMLQQFAQNGGKILFINDVPQFIDGCPDERINTLLQNNNTYTIVNRRDLINKALIVLSYDKPVKVTSSKSGEILNDIIPHVRTVNDCKLIYLWNRNRNDIIDAKIDIKGNWQFKIIALEEDIQVPIFTDRQCGISSCNIKFYPGQSILLKAEINKENLLIAPMEQTVRKLEYIKGPWEVVPLEPNCLTIDYASYRLGDGEFSSSIPIIKIQDIVYSQIKNVKDNKHITMQYEFYADFTHVPDDICMVIEQDNNMKEISINDLKVTFANQSNWWLDRGFIRIPICRYLQNGCNVIDIKYELKDWNPTFKVDEVFESERNRFSYPVEFENIYIIGSMDVELDGNIECKTANYISVHRNKFILKDTQPKQTYDDIIEQNLWFYRGAVRLSKKIKIDCIPDSLLISIPQLNGIFLKLYINSKYVNTLVLPPYEADITQYIKKGTNTVTLEFMGSNRNALGPHHHIVGEPKFFGPSIFKGIKGWEDFVNTGMPQHTWTNNYNFVKLGLVHEPILIYK